MLKLSQTVNFSKVEKLYGFIKVLNTLYKEDRFKYYEVPYDLYEHYVKLFKSYKYPFVHKIIDAVENRNIKLIMLSDPHDQSQDPIINFPSFITFFNIKPKNESEEKTVTYCNVTLRASYVRSKVNDKIEYFKINERDLYTYLNGAYIYRVIELNSENLSRNSRFILSTSEAFASMIFRAIDKNLSIGLDTTSVMNFMYDSMVYFMNFPFDLDIEKSKELALRSKLVDKPTIVNTNILYREDTDFSKGLDDYCKTLEKEFSNIIRAGSLKPRPIIDMYTNMYGQNSFLSLEHVTSFVTMLELAYYKLGFFNDLLISTTVDKRLKDIEEELYKY